MESIERFTRIATFDPEMRAINAINSSPERLAFASDVKVTSPYSTRSPFDNVRVCGKREKQDVREFAIPSFPLAFPTRADDEAFANMQNVHYSGNSKAECG